MASSRFPVDNLTLAAVEHALWATYVVDDEGRLALSEGCDFDIPGLLAVYSQQQRFTLDDVCLALIAEIRRLRAEFLMDEGIPSP